MRWQRHVICDGRARVCVGMHLDMERGEISSMEACYMSELDGILDTAEALVHEGSQMKQRK
jgi:hypothetical protein